MEKEELPDGLKMRDTLQNLVFGNDRQVEMLCGCPQQSS
jgi:hypothetical protein